MELIILLFILGIVLLAAEVFAPGAILGIFGSLAMLAGAVLSFAHFGMGGGFLALAVVAVLLGLTFWLEFRIIPRTAFGRRMQVLAKVEATSQAPVGTDALVGQEGETSTTLAPSGYVTVAGRRYEAFSDSGHLPAGTPVRIRAHDTFRLIVTKK